MERIETKAPFKQALDILLERCQVMAAEEVPLVQALGRVLAEDILAVTDIPPFARSPYDGYAIKASDSLNASRKTPVCLEVVEEIPAGAVPSRNINAGTATKIMTGAAIPEGADTVIMQELTTFTEKTVTIFESFRPGCNIIIAGEDVKAGCRIARRGEIIDPFLAGSLASQGLTRPKIFKKPQAGLISIGSELVEAEQLVPGGAIRNSNRYTLMAACATTGAEPVYLGLTGDKIDDIVTLITRGLDTCDILLCSGGVSGGDYDLTPTAMEKAGIEILVTNLGLKPGRVCAIGIKGEKLIFGLSGNPPAAMTIFSLLGRPCLRKLSGYAHPGLRATKVTLLDNFNKSSQNIRIISGWLDITDGVMRMKTAAAHGHAVMHALAGCEVLAVIPAGSPPLPAGTILEAYLLT